MSLARIYTITLINPSFLQPSLNLNGAWNTRLLQSGGWLVNLRPYLKYLVEISLVAISTRNTKPSSASEAASRRENE
ncbi:hypothetical protein CEXT_506011 [Caerostris extrusa]|uniref:Uncharacterized protein n=1 Tax=Caerostris extrusa TaxID=172846 RepID=A0AAV4MBC0_CAEEX|nr:hypothetical protein CEXT_506011 [Caerostris extrusa]